MSVVPAITALYAAPLAILFLVLSWRVIGYRRAAQIGLGDGGDKGLMKRMRAQANCAEYVPIALVLLLLAELLGAPAMALHLLGATLVFGRVLHAWGFSTRPPVMGARVAGMGLTLLMVACTAGLLLVLALT